MARAMRVEKASYTLQICESKKRAVTWRGTAAFPGRVMITLCFHEFVGEEAGSSKSLLDAVHGVETTGKLYLEVPTRALAAGGEAALPQDGAAAGCPASRSCRKRSAFLRDLLVLQGCEGAP